MVDDQETAPTRAYVETLKAQIDDLRLKETGLKIAMTKIAAYEKRIAELEGIPPVVELAPIEYRNEEAGFVEFVNDDRPYIVRDIPAPAAVLVDMETRQVIGYRVYDPGTLPPVDHVAGASLDWTGFKGIQINKEWLPDDQELIYTAMGVYDGDGDMDDDAREQIIERLLSAWKNTASDIGQATRQLIEGGEMLLQAEAVVSDLTSLLQAAQGVIASASDTYKKRNGHLASFEDDSGEKCWIVPFDAFESLRSAVAALKPEGAE